MEFDEIPPLPEFRKEDLHEVDEELAIEEFRNGSCRFMFYENERGETKVYFDKLDAPLYAAMVAKFSSPDFAEVNNYWKLVMEGARLMQQQTKKGHEMAVRIEKHLKAKIKK